MRRSPTYKFEQFGQGDVYSASADRRRFVSLDYNADRFVGIVGDGIAVGWNLSESSPLVIQVSYGMGFINGMVAETRLISPMKRRSQIISGETIIEEIPGWSDPNPNSWEGHFYKIGGSDSSKALVFDHLGPSGEQNDEGQTVVLAPAYRTANEQTWEDPLVKAMDTAHSQVAISDNADNYIYAVRSSDQVDNTGVEFVCLASATTPARSLLLGVVKTRSGVSTIDESESIRLHGLVDFVQGSSADSVQNHHHGGTAKYDPPAIQLNTDVRETICWDQTGGAVTYKILSNLKTGSSQGHYHTYELDADGNGWTVGLSGGGPKHYHPIYASSMSGPSGNHGEEITDHTHTFANTVSSLDSDCQPAVYLNGVLVDESQYTINHDNATVTFLPGVASYKYATYSSTIDLGNNQSFTFEGSYPSSYRFLRAMMQNFANKYRSEMSWYDAEGGEITASIRDPFYFAEQNQANIEPGLDGFYSTDPTPVNTPLGDAEYLGREPYPPPTILGLGPVEQQGKMAAIFLREAEDTYTVLPKAARFIDIRLVTPPVSDSVRVEILDGVEVTGVLPSENIAFVSAQKIAEGVLSVSQIPFLGHGGRFNEPFSPLLSKTTTTDGTGYYVLPTWTSIDNGHKHKVSVDTMGNGNTISTVVGGKSVNTAGDPAVRIAHTHRITNYSLSPQTSNGINTWQNLTTGSSHTHTLEAQYAGYGKSIFACVEDDNNNVWAGTSDGLMCFPATFGLEVSIRGKTYHLPSTTALTTVKQAIALYEYDTGDKTALVSESDSQTLLATLAADGDSVTLSALIQKGELWAPLSIPVTAIVDFVVDGLCSYGVYRQTEISNQQTPLRTYRVPLSYNLQPTSTYQELLLAAGAYTSGIEDESLAEEDCEDVIWARNDIAKEPIWCLKANSEWLVAASPSRVYVAQNNLWKILPWTSQTIYAVDFFTTNTLILATNTGGYSVDLQSLGVTRLNLGENTILRCVASTSTVCLVGGDHGVWYSLDGKIWTKVIYGHCANLVVDADAGRFFCIQSDLSIVYSDDGATWAGNGLSPSGFGAVGQFWADGGVLYAATINGVVQSTNGGLDWTLAFAERALCFGQSVDGFFLGGYHSLWEHVSAFELVKTTGGGPPPFVTVDGEPQFFHLAWSNSSQCVYFRTPPTTSAVVKGTFGFGTWYATNGAWATGKDIKITIDGRIVVDTKNSIDKRGDTAPPFEIDPQEGILSFVVQTKTTAGATGSSLSLSLESVDGFSDSGFAVILTTQPVTAEIDRIGTNAIILKRPLGMDVEAGTLVQAGGQVGGETSIAADIYDSSLLNDGRYSHNELENAFSLESTGLQWNMSNDLLNNLNQIVLRLKNPDSPLYDENIDQFLRDWRAYMMRFSDDSGDDLYIENYIDTIASNLRSGTTYSTPFIPMNSGINAIVPGYGDFNGLIFAGTQAGLFACKETPSLKSDWFLIPDCPAGAVYGITFSRYETILVGGANGLYSSSDLLSWNRVSPSTIPSEVSVLGLRWVNFGVPDTSVWWKAWDGATNLVDADIPNTIVAAGTGFITISRDGGKTWVGSTTPFGDDEDYTPVFMAPLANGKAVMGVINANGRNTLLETTDDGYSWRAAAILACFKEIPQSVSINDNSNTILEFSNPLLFPSHTLDGHSLSANGKKWTIVTTSQNTIILLGDATADILANQTTCEVEPIRLNSSTRDNRNFLLVGTNNGLFDDRGVGNDESRTIANVLQANEAATATSVGIEFEVLKVGSDGTVLQCRSNHIVGKNELANQQMVLPDLSGDAINLEISSPTSGETISSATLEIEFEVQGFDLSQGYIAFAVDNGDLSYTASNTAFITALANGAHTITAFLTTKQRAKISNTDASVSFTYNHTTTTPGIHIISPADTQALDSGNLLTVVQVDNFTPGVSGAAYYNFDDGKIVGGFSNFSNSQASVSVTLLPGNHNLVVTLLDANGVQIATDESNFSVNTGSQPAISILTPTNGSTQPGPDLTITYAVNNFIVGVDGQITIRMNGTVVGTSSSSSSTTITNIANGTHTIHLSLSNSTGDLDYASASAEINVGIDASIVDPPTLQILSGTNYTLAPFLPVEFLATNFAIGVDGGILVSIDEGPATYWASTSPYQVPANAPGEIKIEAVLARDASTPLTNTEANATTTLVVTSATRSMANSAPFSANSAPPAAIEPATTTPRSVESTTGSATISTWQVISNTASDANGGFQVTVNGNVPETAIGQNGYLAGENLRVGVSFDRHTPSSTYDGGLAYVDPSSNPNGLSYQILSQGEDRLLLKSNGNQNVRPGERLFLLPATMTATLFVDYITPWGNDELAGQTVRLLSTEGNDNTVDSCVVVGNTEHTITVEFTSLASTLAASTVVLESLPLLPSPGFNHTWSSLDLDHQHPTRFVGKIGGDVVSVAKSGTKALVEVDPSSVANDILLNNPSLLVGAKILFYSKVLPGVVFEEVVYATTSDEISVSINRQSDWNFDNTNPGGIDDSFAWAIDASFWGITGQPEYKEFVILRTTLSADLAAGDQEFTVTDASGISNGDLVIITDNTPSEFCGKVSNVSGSTITLLEQVSKDFLLNNDAQVRVVKDAYSNTHTHLIRNSEIVTAYVDDFETIGYPVAHNHAITHCLKNVCCLNANNGRITMGGSDTKIWSTDNQTWEVEADIARITGDSATPTTMSRTNGGYLAVGLGNGNILIQTTATPSDQPYTHPIDATEMPSSSSSSSHSSLSLSSISSNSTSASSYSSSTLSNSST